MESHDHTRLVFNKKLLSLNTKFNSILVVNMENSPDRRENSPGHGENFYLRATYREVQELIAEHLVLSKDYVELFDRELCKILVCEHLSEVLPKAFQEHLFEYLPGSLVVPFYFNPKTDIFYP